ncbi:hypothetical protein Q9299_09610 [Gemmobacter fulvus]|uniref:hypothetical protein n=1 Tax=Gemmobacter fulvus TaxID=2840474 RepID=UPI00279678F0|nr:hypothetical protein [Gemmobacter fulvus]MDQ1848541.1 hypothetical protein [Gemmobacter fulvus]
MSGLVWIERHHDSTSGKYFHSVVANGRFVKSLWTLSDAVRVARKLAEANGMIMHEAKVVPFERRTSA